MAVGIIEQKQRNENYIPNSALNDYEHHDIDALNKFIVDFYKRVFADGGKIETFVEPKHLIDSDNNFGNRIKDVKIVNGVVEHIELEFDDVEPRVEFLEHKVKDYDNDSNLKLIKIDYANLETKDISGLVKYLNTVAGFVKTSIDNVFFQVETAEFVTPRIEMKFALVNKRKNRYGLGGVLLTEEDVVLLEKNIVELTSSDDSIKIDNNDIIINTEGWQLATDFNSLTPNIQI